MVWLSVTIQEVIVVVSSSTTRLLSYPVVNCMHNTSDISNNGMYRAAPFGIMKDILLLKN